MKKYVIGCLSLAFVVALTMGLAAKSTNATETESTTASGLATATPVKINFKKVSAGGAKPTIVSKMKLFSSILRRGQSSDEIKELQNILKEDEDIYPEGLVTGYYGPLTERAVKRLQKKYGLPQTGIVDENTQAVIFPSNLELKIIAPNGGEVWDKSEPHIISWEAKISPPRAILEQQEAAETEAEGEAESESSALSPVKRFKPLYTRASLDLIGSGPLPMNSNSTSILPPKALYHIATVNLYDAQYQWIIPAKIPEGKYRVRISVGSNIVCFRAPCPTRWASDTSDEPFSITGSTATPGTIARLKALANQMENTVRTLLKQIESLKSLLENL